MAVYFLPCRFSTPVTASAAHAAVILPRRSCKFVALVGVVDNISSANSNLYIRTVVEPSIEIMLLTVLIGALIFTNNL